VPRVDPGMSASNSGFIWAKMVHMNEGFSIAALIDGVDEDDRIAAIARLRDLFSTGELSLDGFSELLDKVFTAADHADLEAVMLALPPLVPLTPTSRRLTTPLILQAADGGLQLGSGWQLASDTTISTGFGAARVDLTAASWDSCQINLHLETWGSIEVLVPEGVAVQLIGGSGQVHLESLSTPATWGPVLRISTSGPTGVIRIRHPKKRNDGFFTRWKRRRSGGRSSAGKEVASP
jgi:uncharacterized protein DUF1707